MLPLTTQDPTGLLVVGLVGADTTGGEIGVDIFTAVPPQLHVPVKVDVTFGQGRNPVTPQLYSCIGPGVTVSFPEPATEPVVLNATKPLTVNASPALGTLREEPDPVKRTELSGRAGGRSLAAGRRVQRRGREVELVRTARFCRSQAYVGDARRGHPVCGKKAGGAVRRRGGPIRAARYVGGTLVGWQVVGQVLC